MLQPGEDAPDFTLESDAGNKTKLSSYRGRYVVVYFYPKDDTPGCTREAIAFSEALASFERAGAVVLGVSKDSVASHAKFRDKHGLRIPLLSDPDLAVHDAFGAYGEKTMYGKKVKGTIRSTFVIDPKGKIAKVFPSVKVDGHADAVLRALAGGGDDRSGTAKPAAKKPAAENPAAKPAGKKPAAKPAAKKPAAKKPAAKSRD